MKLPLILLEPFIGKYVEIVDSRDPTLVGRRGKIVFESRNMFGILEDGRTKVFYVPKNICTFKIFFSKKRIIIVDGSLLVNRFMRLRKFGRKRR